MSGWVGGWVWSVSVWCVLSVCVCVCVCIYSHSFVFYNSHITRRYLYYVHNLRIWRRDLNGKNPQQIKTQDAWSSIDGLSIHMQTNTLYWSTGNVVYGKNLSDAASTGTVLIDDSRYLFILFMYREFKITLSHAQVRPVF